MNKIKKTVTTKSGKVLKVNRGISSTLKMRKELSEIKKAERMNGMPTGRVKRLFWKLHPLRVLRYWFSRAGFFMALKLTGLGLVVGFLVIVGVFAYFRKDIPNLKDISGSNIGGSIRYYDRSGNTLLWEDYDAVKRTPVASENISQNLKDAIVAVEDRQFFEHHGFNLKAIVRAVINNASGQDQQGGSTITQQLASLTTPGFTKDKTYERKIKELIISIEIERTYTKDEILTGYLNSAPFGGIEYGAEVAAQTYFGKSAKDLTVEESAMLASIPKSPSYYGPYSASFSPKAFKGRKDYTIKSMRELGYISKEEEEAALASDIIATVKPRNNKYQNIKSPYFVLAAKSQLEEKFGDKTYDRGGWKVITTLDTEKQQIADEEFQKGLAKIYRQGGNTAAFVAEDVKTGQVVAMIGGANFADDAKAGQINYAQTFLPPGSSFKPYDYTALIETQDNYGAGTAIYDTQGPIPGYPCTNKALPENGGNCLWNYSRRYPGPMTLRYSLGGSKNVPAVKAFLTAGIEKTIEIASNLGLKSGYKCFEDAKNTIETTCYGSAGIGDGAYLKLDEHVHGYSTLSRNGNKVPQTYILKITDDNEKVVDEWKPSTGEQAVRPDSAYIVADMMSDPKPSYFGVKPHNYKGFNFGLKTGTTNDAKDGWMLGFSTQYSAGIWVGTHDRSRAMTGGMEEMTLPIWQGFMRRVHDKLTPEPRVKPAGVQTLPAYQINNKLEYGAITPSPATDLYPSWYKKPDTKASSGTKIDKVSGKVATDCTPISAVETTQGNTNGLIVDKFVKSASSTASSDKDDVHNCGDLKPSVNLSLNKTSSGTILLSASVIAGTHPLSSEKFPGSIVFKVNNSIVTGGSFQIESCPGGVCSLTYTPTDSGTLSVTAELTDSVLYSASDLKEISIDATATPTTLAPVESAP